MARIKLLKDPADPQPIEIMERAIVDVAEGARKLLGSKLNDRAIIVLLRDQTGESLITIERVLKAAANLDKSFLKAVVLAVAVAATAACAGAPAKIPCNDEPQWTASNARGRDLGVFVCFGPKGVLMYAVRPIPKKEVAP